MRVLVQPDDGIRTLVKGINGAKHSIEIVIFRFDEREIHWALAHAVTRGVSVRALIAYTNRAGEETLRKLELALLAAGITVARTDDDLDRYHDKLMITDRRVLYLLAFNWTHMDIERSRSFGVITTNQVLVREALRLFEADVNRHPYEPGAGNLVVSPVNARKRLTDFLKGAKKRLIIYDPKVSDPAMIHLLEERCRAGVDIAILGRMTRCIPGVTVRKLAPMRLHTRTMVRDGYLAFVGSQSLRAVELDSRREVGLIFRDPKAVARLAETFARDWDAAEQAAQQTDGDAPAAKVARKVAKLLTKDLPEVAPVLNGVVKEMVGGRADVNLRPEEVEAAVRGAVKEAVKEAVSDMVQEVVENQEECGR
jgi:phosphatidylserine/phosphatidylglycerophosphate/cardiolipin synthase-like enzyme